MITRPMQDEYGAYYGRYIDFVPDGDLVQLLAAQMQETAKQYSALTKEQEEHRYAPGKWSVKEVLGHLIDTERIMSYRLLRFARADETDLAGYDDEAYVAQGSFSSRPLSDLLEEYKAVRLATIALLKGLPEESWMRKGTANNNVCSVRALAFIIAGHELHHRNILVERYEV
ncbi:DinB family protein [Brevibacillus nitrificans]|uniref:DinB family protein n=1 Tax=Brevibacillus nitrificans TaxID=651560 RepID=UPI00285692AB|nr:DinB family protein [Brevibacillus nitrificans]MDR7317402.1 putative damage-inducible protein DinB [Brevibacillus nitrificans]